MDLLQDPLRWKREVLQVVLRPAASVSPSSLLEIEILRPHHRPTESKAGRKGVLCVFGVGGDGIEPLKPEL